MAGEVKDTIESIAKDGIKRAQGDQGSVETHSIQDLIAADKHLTAKKASRNPMAHVKRVRISPPGGTGT